jgi:predicted ATP-grasp superfamily ATP-dependent carboligase
MDPLASAPGSHSRFVTRRLECASPRFEPLRFIEEITRALRELRIDLFLPLFEEVFYLGKHLDELSGLAEVFSSPFDTLARLHHKGRLIELARSLEIATPATTVVTDARSLRDAIAAHERFVARPVYSRGGTRILTNVGPLRGRVPIERCRPSDENPWLVQEYIPGEELCTFGVARHGRLSAHCSYTHPVELEHGSGIVYVSVDEPGTLPLVTRLVEATGFHGQIGFDFRRTDEGRLVLVECNPRATAGVLMMPAARFAAAVTDAVPERPYVVPAGVRRKISLALIREMLHDWRLVPEGLRYLLSRATKDVFLDLRDPLPALSQLFTYPQIAGYRRYAGADADPRTVIVEAYSYDMAWDGAPIP